MARRLRNMLKCDTRPLCQSFVDTCHSDKIDTGHSAESGHLSSALAHLGNISWKLGAPTAPDAIRAALKDANTTDAFERMLTHLADNKVDATKDILSLGKHLTFNAKTEQFTGDSADLASPHLKGTYRKGFELPV